MTHAELVFAFEGIVLVTTVQFSILFYSLKRIERMLERKI